MRALVSSLARHPWWWLVASLVVAALSIWQSTQLRLRADLLSMLPQDVPAAVAYRSFLEEFGGLERVFVIVSARPEPDLVAWRAAREKESESTGSGRGASSSAATTFERADGRLDPDDLDSLIIDTALQLEERLSGEPTVRHVRAGLEAADEQFFLEYIVPRTVLRDPRWTVERLRLSLTDGALAQRALDLRGIVRNPAGEFDARLARFDPLGFARESLFEEASELGIPVDPLSGVFKSPLGSALLMIEPSASELDSDAGRALADRLDALFAEFEIASNGAVEISAVGGPLYAVEDERLIRSDLESTISVSLVGCLAVLVLAFGGWRVMLVATLVLATAFAWAVGLLTWWRGELLAVSLGFAAVLVGLGIDYVIHAVTRYRQVLAEGQSPEQALQLVSEEISAPLFASSMTTAAAFAVLMASQLRPLNEIGLLVSVGIVAMLVATVFVGGPTMVLFVRGERSPRWAPLWGWAGRLAESLVRFGRRHRVSVIAVAVVLFLLGAASATQLRFQPRFEDLRSDDYKLAHAETLLASEFGLGVDTAAVLVRGHDFEDALRKTRLVTDELTSIFDSPVDTAGGSVPSAEPMKVTVSSPADLLVAADIAEERRLELQTVDWLDAVTRFEQDLIANGLDPRGFAPGLGAMRALATGQPLEIGRDLPWPDWITAQLSEDTTGSLVLLRIRTDERGSAVLAEESTSVRLAEALTAAFPGAKGEDVRVASAVALGDQMTIVGQREVGGLAAGSLAVVLIVVALALRASIVATVLSLVPIVFGASVAFGLLAITAGRLDFLSLAVVPILFGIGIDDGLHALCGRPRGVSQREWLARTSDRIGLAGRAVTLTSLTTLVGFGSLGTSSMPGLRHGGLVVAVGVLACWLATLLVLPALTSGKQSLSGAEASGGSCDPQSAPPGHAAPSQTPIVSQAPTVSSFWRRVLGPLHFSSPTWYRVHAWTMRTMPEWVITVAMVPVVAIFFLALTGVRRALIANRRAISGPSRWGILGDAGRAFRTLWNHAWCFSETYEGMFDSTRRSLASVKGEDNWRQVTQQAPATPSMTESFEHSAQGAAVEAPSGFVIITAHVGHWEVGSHLSQFEEPRRIHVVREPEIDPEAQKFLRSMLEGQGDDHYQVHFAGADNPMLGGLLLGALRKGDVVALQGDRPRAGGRTVEVRLFDKPYALPVGPFAIARAARVPLLPVFVFRVGRASSALNLRTPIRVTRSNQRSHDLQSAAQQFAGELEWAISEHPDQWFCLRRVWPEAGRVAEPA